MPDQHNVVMKGGTMRLGTLSLPYRSKYCSSEHLWTDRDLERHRHRYEVNNKFRQALVDAGITISGTSPDGKLVEMIELKNHPYFVGCPISS